ncbi:MAG: DUF4255 domain-containing protein [bacterium]|nr:DUF4255 domain-containing protein [bacterium]
MSNYLSIAAVTEILKEAIADSVSTVVPGVKVSSLRPKDADTDPPEARVNLYLYQSNPNPAFRNEDLPTRSSTGELRQRPRAVLDLDFLVSFYGDHSLLEHQRLMGGVVTLLHAQPLLSPEFIDMIIQKILDNDPTNYLGDADLSEQPESIRLTPIILNLEETSKIWSVFFQVPHALSIAYRASAVFLEPDSVPKPVLPVRQRNIVVETGSGPYIDCVTTHDDATAPILTGSELCLVGARLEGEITTIRVDNIEVVPEMITPTMLHFFLPAGLRAGTRTVQVVHKRLVDTEERIRAVSNSVGVLLRPSIDAVTIGFLNIDAENNVTTQVTLGVQPAVEPGQRVLLKINEKRSDGLAGASYVIESDPVTASTNSVVFQIVDAVSAEYLMRVEIDGAESILESIDPISEGAYDQPILNLTPVPPVMRVSLTNVDLTGSGNDVRARVFVMETITLPDNSTQDVDVVGATVDGTWTFPDTSTLQVSDVTSPGPGGNVRAVFREPVQTGQWTFTVDNVSKAGYEFDAGSSVLSETITV